MHNHRGRPTDTSHFVHILMRGHHASGGAAPEAPMGSSRGNMSDNTSHYRKGGKTHRRHHADGDMTGVSPITGERSPDVLAKRRGGRACHAEGDTVAIPQKRGGPSTKRKHGRACHGWGDFVHGVENVGKKIGSGFRDAGNAVGNAVGNAAHNAQRAANYVFNQRHAEGDMVATPQKRGGKTRRKHHAFGDSLRAQFGPGGKGYAVPRRLVALGQVPGLGGQSAVAPEEGLRHGGKAHHKRHRHADGDTTEMMARGGPKKKSYKRTS